MFLGTVAAGMPLLITADVAGQAHDHASSARGDAVFEHLAREVARIHNRVQRRGPRGDDARALASAIRTMKVYAGQIDFDGKVKKGLRSLVNKRGREELLFVERDTVRSRAELRRFGVDVPEHDNRRTPPPDYATRTKALDQLLARGVSPSLDRLATAFEEAADVLDRAGAVPIRRVRDAISCASWAQTIAILEYESNAMCALSILVPAALTACAMLLASLATYQAFYWYNC
jgi:hypothetical protein